MNALSRRGFLAASSIAALSGTALSGEQPVNTRLPSTPSEGDAHRGPCVVGSLNGLRSCIRAHELIMDGYDPADAIVQGVRIIEDDPEDDSVGLGGLPNADGVVELDASVMHGPTHKSGAVASLRNIKNPAMVALMVLRRTDHCLLVGEGALNYAKSLGFRDENLLTENARLQWLRWKENMSRDDDWLNDDERDAPVGKTWTWLPWQSTDAKEGAVRRTNDGPEFVPSPRESPPGSPGGTSTNPPPGSAAPRKSSSRPFIVDVTGTVHCSALTPKGDIASCTSTSGLNWKIPGRVGDSPIIGAGNYCDNDIGAAGSTGRGEANIVNLASYAIVERMDRGLTPTQACLEVAKKVVDHTKEKRLLHAGGKPTFDLKFYALRKDGAYGGASLFKGGKFAVHDWKEAKVVDAAYLFESR